MERIAHPCPDTPTISLRKLHKSQLSPISPERHPRPMSLQLALVVPHTVNVICLPRRSPLIVVQVHGRTMCHRSILRATGLFPFPIFKADPCPGGEMDPIIPFTQISLSRPCKINTTLRLTNQVSFTIYAPEALLLPKIRLFPRSMRLLGAAIRQFLPEQKQLATRRHRVLAYSHPYCRRSTGPVSLMKRVPALLCSIPLICNRQKSKNHLASDSPQGID